MMAVEEKTEREERSALIDGVLLTVQVQWWRGKEVLNPKDLGLDASDVPEFASLGRKLVVPKRALDAFATIYSRVDYLTGRFAFPFPTGRAHFVPYTVLPEVLLELKKLEERFGQETQAFMAQYQGYRDEIIALYPQWRDALRSRYEDPTELAGRFSFRWTIFEIVLPQDLRVQAVSADAAMEEAKGRREAMQEASAQYREQYQKQMDEFLGGSVLVLRQKVAESVLRVKDQLAAGQVNTKALTSIRKAIEDFRNLNFMGDLAVEAQLEELMVVLPRNADALEGPMFNQTFSAIIDQVAAAVTNTDVSTVTGEYRRRVRL